MGNRIKITVALAALAVVVVIVAFVVMSGFFSGPQAFERSDLVAPSMTILNNNGTGAPGAQTGTFFDASLSLGFEYMPVTVGPGINEVTAFVYRQWGGVIDTISVENEGLNKVFVWSVGVRWDGNSTVSNSNCSTLIAPGQTVDLGILHIDGPGAPGTYSLELVLDIWTSSPSGMLWYDYGDYVMDSDLSLRSVDEPSYVERTLTLNEGDYYNSLNELVDFEAVDGGGWATSIQNAVPGEYDLVQVIAAFEMVAATITYLPDDQDQFVGDDHWQTVEETLQLGTGDCEDQAVLMASIVTVLGGNCRINLIPGHAFATVYIGDSENDTAKAEDCVQAYYGTDVPIFWIEDELGYWLVIDTAGMCYAGGYPASCAPVDPDGGASWNFEDGDWIDMVDITGEPSGTFLI